MKRGSHHTPETRAKMRAAHLGKPLAMLPPFTDEHRQRISAALTGRVVPPETRARMSIAQHVRRDADGAIPPKYAVSAAGLEHRLIMEAHLGRKLGFNEIVHHINHDKRDNRLENLEVMDRGDHTRHHLKKRP